MRTLIATTSLLLFMAGAAFSATYYVPDHYTTIQSAISSPAVSNGDIIIVRQGTYTEVINFQGKKITVMSEKDDPALTVIDGNQLGSVVTFNTGETWSSVLDGFTVTNGSAANGGGISCVKASPTIKNCIIRDNTASGSGGGIYCYDSSYPKIRDNEICNNTAVVSGGGIHCSSASPPTEGNLVRDNSAAGHPSGSMGGGIYCEDCDAVFTDNVVRNNSADKYGGGIYCNSGSLDITETKVQDNGAEWGGGIYCGDDTSSVEIADSTVTGNSATYGGGLFCMSSPSMTNNLIAGNTADDGSGTVGNGGGLFCQDASVVLTNNTVYLNTAAVSGGGLYSVSDGGTQVTNAILWGNAPDQVDALAGGYPLCEYSDVEGGDPGGGTGNIDADPAFVDPDGADDDPLTWADNDLRLDELSPCINQGSAAAPDLPEKDFEGDPRDYEGVDMGMDERYFPEQSLMADPYHVSASTGGIVDFTLYAGPDHAGREYFLLGGMSGTVPGQPLPGGLIMPLNWDVFTKITIRLANSPVFPNTFGTLDASGTSYARMNTFGPLPKEAVGLKIYFAYTLIQPFDFVSNPVEIEIVQ